MWLYRAGADGITEFRNPLAAKEAHIEPGAGRVIFPSMESGPSQVDTFDYKPFLVIADEIATSVDQSTCQNFRRAFPEISGAADRSEFELPGAA
jgi:hypothetical protein